VKVHKTRDLLFNYKDLLVSSSANRWLVPNFLYDSVTWSHLSLLQPHRNTQKSKNGGVPTILWVDSNLSSFITVPSNWEVWLYMEVVGEPE